MRGRIWAALWVWLAAVAMLLAGHAELGWATPAPGTPLPGERPPIVPGAAIPATPKPKPAVRVRSRAPARTPAAAAQAGPPGTGKSNLACMVFEGRTGLDARSTLYNRCGTGVRLNYCLQYKNGADNCVPMTVGWEATLWDLLAGQSLVMPATDTLKRWAVFACETPLTPWQAVFRNGNLIGDCVETGLEPPPGAPAPKPTIRSNDPSTWPAGTVNMQCVIVPPVLTPTFQMQLINRCGRPVNVAVCATTNVAVGWWPCVTPVPDKYGPPTGPDWPVIEGLPKPSQIVRWSAFACEDPAYPRNLRYDGTKLVGDCIAEPQVNTATALPRRGGNAATSRLSAETSAEDLSARAQQRSEASQAIDAERSRISKDTSNVLGVLADVALTTTQTYLEMKAQQQQIAAANAVAPQQNPLPPQNGYTPSQTSNAPAPTGSSGRREVLVDHATGCAQVVDQHRDSDVEGMIWFAFHNSCSFPINIWHDQYTDGRFGGMSPAPAGGNSSRSWENPARYGRTGIAFIACPQFMNGQTVYKKDGANGGFYCYYWSS